MVTHSPINTFLEFGQLPIVLREGLHSQVFSFIEKANQAGHIRCGLITGEAGSGKTSFIKLLLPELTEKKFIPLHVRFYAESETLLTQILTTAINSDNILGTGKIVGNSINDIVPILRKLARTRLTVIVIEDIHLLNESSQSELIYLIDALVDEPITILALGRPISEKIRSLIEVYLEDEWKIQGLTKDEITQIWHKTFGSEPEEKLIASLYSNTKGNALVLRAALRAFVKKEMINVIEGIGYFDSPITKANSVIQSCSRSVSDAMLLSVNKHEIDCAATLATLGEVFSEEVATMLLGSKSDILRLKQSGIIAETHLSIIPIPGSPQNTLDTMAFTHSIVHERLLKEASVNSENFLEVVANNKPIFSYVYFEFLLHLDTNETCLETLKKAFENLLDLYVIGLQSVDIAYSERIFECAKKLLKAMENKVSEKEFSTMHSALTCGELYALRHNMGTQDYLHRITLLIEDTKNFITQEEADIRLNALMLYPYSKVLCGLQGDLLSDWELITKIIEKFPLLRYSDNYISCLDSFLSIVIDKPNITGKEIIIETVSKEFHSLINDNQLQEDLQEGLLQTVGSNLLHQDIVSKNDIEERRNLLVKLERIRNLSSEILTSMVRFLIRIGDFSKAEKILQRAENEANKTHHRSSQINCQLYKLLIIGLNESSKQFVVGIENFIKLFPRERILLATLLVYVAHFKAENKKNLQTLLDIRSNIDSLSIEFRLFYAQLIEDKILFNQVLNEFVNNPLCKVLCSLVGNTATKIRADKKQTKNKIESKIENRIENRIESKIDCEKVINLLANDIFLLPNVANKICLLREILSDKNILSLLIKKEYTALNTAIKQAIQDIADWFLLNKMFSVLQDFVGEFSKFIEIKKLNEIKNELKKNQRNRLAKETDKISHEGKLHITLLGEITVTLPFQKPEKIRGERIKSILGAIAANHIISQKLSLNDFNSIVTDETDPSNAKIMMRKIRFRLREIISDEYLIQSENEPISFDSSEVIIDVVELTKHLKESLKFFKENRLINSCNSLIQAFDIAQDKVAFPNLYSEFFESLREDIENRLREAALRLGSKLVDEHYVGYAEELLTKALRFVPSDDDIAYWLEKSLIMQNKQAEAELVRRSVQD